jgi:peptidyl-prolyl cis-trans isomerase D
MAKKSTTGGPKSRRVTAEDIQRRKEYRSKAERERMWQQRVVIVTGVLVALSVIVLLAAILYEQVIVPRQAITTVNGEDISTRDFQERVRYMRWLTAQQLRNYYFVTGDTQTVSQYAEQLRNAVQFGSPILDEMEEEILIKDEAKRRGITVDTAAVNKQVDQYMADQVGLTLPQDETATPTLTPTVTLTPLVSPTPSSTPVPTDTPTPLPTPTGQSEEESTPGPTATPTIEPTITLTPTATATLEPNQIQATIDTEADDFYTAATDNADVNRDVVRDVFYYDALRQALVDDMGKDLPTEELQVNARHILISFDPNTPAGQQPPPPTDEQKAAAQARADDVMQALQDGEPFADLAKAMSNDTGSAQNGGELGWASPDNYVGAFADTVTESEIGAIVGPIETEFGYHIIQVLGREVRPLTEAEINSRRQETFQNWLNEAKANADIKRNENWIERIPDQPTYNDLLGDILG